MTVGELIRQLQTLDSSVPVLLNLGLNETANGCELQVVKPLRAHTYGHPIASRVEWVPEDYHIHDEDSGPVQSVVILTS